jgi:hypothetical protein
MKDQITLRISTAIFVFWLTLYGTMTAVTYLIANGHCEARGYDSYRFAGDQIVCVAYTEHTEQPR